MPGETRERAPHRCARRARIALLHRDSRLAARAWQAGSAAAGFVAATRCVRMSAQSSPPSLPSELRAWHARLLVRTVRASIFRGLDTCGDPASRPAHVRWSARRLTGCETRAPARRLQQDRGFHNEPFDATAHIYRPSRPYAPVNAGYSKAALEACSSGNVPALRAMLSAGLRADAQNEQGLTVRCNEALPGCGDAAHARCTATTR